tara:strand:- start:43 stop:435 length:393 start_codon:yes stop_codon:yes gene_type:complete
MGIEDDFYASVKLRYSGEEIFAKVAASEEEDRTLLIVSNPVVITETKVRNRTAGYSMEPWLKTSTEDMFILNMDDVLTMSESNNIEMILCYEDCINKMFRSNYSELDRKMGYLGTVEDTKKSLEKLFKAS